MHIKRIAIALALTPILISSHAVAEKGLAYDSVNSVWRTGYGECWTTSHRDKAPADTSCFGEPAMEMTKAEGDADNDGVVDSKDQCPGTPAGVQVDDKGCALDSDGDGVADSKDDCPNTPAGATVTDAGCAVQIVLQNVLFDLNSDKVSGEYTSTLNQIADSLKARPDIKSIEVIGHTDSTGSAAYNQSLSERRAKAVADNLKAQGVNGALFTTKGMGEASPVADNATAEGRAQNRRVELKLD
ncbi:MAG: OmpA family protein [Candidatus Thiodiazotropha endolucinida]